MGIEIELARKNYVGDLAVMEMRKRNKHYFKLSVQIILLVVSIFAFAYILNYYTGEPIYIVKEYKSINWRGILKLLLNLLISEKGLVSALENSDLNDGVKTCAKAKDGSVCQEYPASECKDKCAVDCFPSTRDKTVDCKLGTCFDPSEGTCNEGSPKARCEGKGGEWFDEPFGNVPRCKKVCCIIGNEVAPLVTARTCAKMGERGGITTTYRADVVNELACFALAHTEAEGACVVESNGGKNCQFIKKGECNSKSGKFHEGMLCSHLSLNSGCKKQASAKCVEGKDELYWFDSCGNRENIYDAINKDKNWNKGIVLTKEQSCQLGDSGYQFKNQKECGNCNRFLGSICGQKTAKEKLDDGSINFVCRDMRCKNRDGKIRENGESWCEYQGAIGRDEGSGGFLRGVDTVGSTHYRMTCVDGEVVTNNCDEYRNEVCVEERMKRESGGEISSAACIKNLWQLCLSYNKQISDAKGKTERQKATEKRDEECGKNPHCILKEVDIADNFEFKLCAPKYAPGFDLQKNAEGGELSCSFGNQKCTVISVKEISGWEVKVNEGCLKGKFAEQMNDLCMSLGDCGAKVNYLGDFGFLDSNYKVYNSPKLGDDYLDKVEKYGKVVEGLFAEVNATEYLNVIGGFEKLGGKFEDPTPEGLTKGSLIAGAISGAVGVNALIVGKLGALFTLPIPQPVFAGIGGAVAGASIGFAVTALLIQITGIGAGLDPAVTWTLIGAGTVAGAFVGAAAASSIAGGASFGTFGASLFGGVIGLGPLGLIIIVVVIIVIVIFTALGIGDTKKKIVEFQCQPWQSKLGGDDCGKCGSEGYACTRYACQALGQNCRLLNEEGTPEERKCVNIGRDDVRSPEIRPWKELISKDYEYKDENERGVKIVGKENEGCIKAYERLLFGISLNEPGQCRYDTQHTTKYDDMKYEFMGRNLFLYNHSQIFTIPDLTSLGAQGYDPNRKADVNLYARCIDGNGNGKDKNEYVINFCVKPGDDVTPPVIVGRNPFREEIGIETTELTGTVYLDNPSSCKWSLDANKKYNEMENSMECENDVVNIDGLFRWSCSSEFSVEKEKEEKNFYIRCKDQPWYGEGWEGEGSDIIKPDESKRNEMPEPYKFVVKRIKSPLKIESAKPDNENFVFGKVQSATVNIEVQTSGGVDNGKAECKIFTGTTYAPMSETFGTTHKQPVNLYFNGENSYMIKCWDAIGNSDERQIKFNAIVDGTSPKITRVYEKDGDLIVVTNEEGKCSFTKEEKRGACNFEFDKGTLMSGEGLEHTADFDRNSLYNIKCRDKLENDPGSCSMIVRGGKL